MFNYKDYHKFQTKNVVIAPHEAIFIFTKVAKFRLTAETLEIASTTPSVYMAFDAEFSTSTYYRLTINELNGAFNYSKIIFLEKGSDKSIKISQNTEGSIFVETNDKIELIMVTNTIGQVIKITKDKAFLIHGLNVGIYIVSVKTDKNFLSQRYLKNKD